MQVPLKQKRRFNAVPQIIKYLQFVLSTRIEIHVCFGLVTSNYFTHVGQWRWRSGRVLVKWKLRSQIRLPSQVIFFCFSSCLLFGWEAFCLSLFPVHRAKSIRIHLSLFHLLLCVSCAIEANNGKNLSLSITVLCWNQV